VHLAVRPLAETSTRYVAAMDGPAKVIADATSAFDHGDYPWAAGLLNHVVMADAGATDARALLARCYDQLA
ncbi:hypothetical protein NL349_28855, partial [Klebsiella pneumoniae]|nr:hypothetical protein [Klebsiella pneumoniae]